VQPVFVEDFGDEGKVNDGVALICFIVADVLKFEVAMSITQLMYNLQLRNNLHPYFRNAGETEALMLVAVVKTLLYFKNVENVSASI
jgi:hypothetical protein